MWRVFYTRTGINIKKVLQMAGEARKTLVIDTRQKEARTAADHFEEVMLVKREMREVRRKSHPLITKCE